MIKLISNFLNSLAEERERKKAEEAKELEHYKVRCTAKLQKLRDKMYTKFCPIQRGPCRCTCVHINQGYVRQWRFDGETTFSVEPPKCKLWKSDY